MGRKNKAEENKAPRHSTFADHPYISRLSRIHSVKFNFPSLSVDAYEYQFKGCNEENNSTDDGERVREAENVIMYFCSIRNII
jgi:hypothetical protein